MDRSSRPSLRNRATCHRPILERLEPRLPPGDAMLGLLLAWPDAPLETFELRDTVESTFDSSDLRAAGLIPAVHLAAHPAGINPAARYTGSSREREPASETRAPGLIPAVYPAGINPAARSAGVFNAEGIANSTPFIVANHARTNGGHSGGPVVIPLPALRAGIHIGPTLEYGTTEVDESHVNDNYGKLPLTFEANQGQTDSRVDFIARTGAGTVFLTPTAAVFALQNSESRIQNPVSEPEALATRAALESVAYASGSEDSAGVAIHMQLVGANPNASPVAQQRQPGIVNYFIGNDPSQWHANIPTFGRIQYHDVYPGIDLAYYGNSGQMEYDFIVSPNADPNVITLNFTGADSVEINGQGDLVLHTAAGDMVQQMPFTYQNVGQTRREVTSRYVLDGTQVSFAVGAYDTTRPLVIDPLVLGYSTFLGGTSSDLGQGIVADGSGNAYVTGFFSSSNFPTTPGAFDPTFNDGGYDAVVTKLNAGGSALAYSTFLEDADIMPPFVTGVDPARTAYFLAPSSAA